MNDIRHAPGEGGVSLRWMTRLLSIVISSVFLLIIFLAITNEDKPRGPAIAVLALLALTIAGCFAAWKWEKAGGVVVIISALCLGVAVYSASLTFGIASLSSLLLLIYVAPFLVIGVLFWVCGQSPGRQSGRKE